MVSSAGRRSGYAAPETSDPSNLVPRPPPRKTPKKQAYAQFPGRSAAIELRGGVRYTGTRLIRGEIRGGKTVGPGVAVNTGATIITCDHSGTYTIKPESHAIDDLGIDSLDFLDIAFAIDKAFGIKLPLEQWTQEVNDGKASTEQYFVLNNLCARIDDLVAAKAK